MSFGGKGGGGGSGSYDYFGTIAGAVCSGVVDELLAIIVDGKEVWPAAAIWKSGQTIVTNNLRSFGSKTWKAIANHTSADGNKPPNGSNWTEYTLTRGSSDFTDVTVVGYGTARIYWGTQSQTQDPLLATAANNFGEDHPDYKGTCYFVFKDFLFGRERTSAPNVEIVVRRKPSQSIVTGTPSGLSDGQANVAAAISEAATSVSDGLGLASSLLDSTSFQAVADAIQTDHANQNASPFLNSQTTLRSFSTDLSLINDAWVRFNPASKKIEAGRFIHGSQPSSPIVLGINDLASVPQFETQSWRDAKTGVSISFTDRERAFKNSTDRVDDLRAVSVLGENRRENIQRPFITRRSQAVQHAAETLRTFGRPQITCKVDVRRERGRSIKPGDWVTLDIDLEPGGAQLIQTFKVTERTIPNRGPIQLTLGAEETLTPIPYIPGVNQSGQLPDLSVPAITDFRIFDVPVGFHDTAELKVGVLAARPAKDIVGFQVWFGLTGAEDQLGVHAGFGVKGSMGGPYPYTEPGAMTCAFTAQADIALLSSSINASEASNAEFLLFAFVPNTETPPQIENNADGTAHMEVMSITSITALGGNDYSIAVDRAKFGTQPQDFPEGTEVWVIRKSSLEFFAHEDFKRVYSDAFFEGYGYFLLQPFTAFATRTFADCAVTTFFWPIIRNSEPVIGITTPNWTGNTPINTQTFAGTGTTQQFAGTVTDINGDLDSVQVIVRNEAGIETTIYSRSKIQGFTHSFDVSYTFSAIGNFDVDVIAVDKLGLISKSTLRVIVAIPSTNVLVPYAKHDSTGLVGAKTQSWELSRIKLFCETPGSTIEWKPVTWKSPDRDTAPTSGWLTYTAGQNLSAALTGSSLGGNAMRIWFRAKKTGLTTSAAVSLTFG